MLLSEVKFSNLEISESVSFKETLYLRPEKIHCTDYVQRLNVV